MTEESQPPAADTQEDALPRSFPVPRNRPVLVHPDDVDENDGPPWRRRALLVLSILAVAAGGVIAWLSQNQDSQPQRSRPPAEVRVPSSDPAVETYFTPSLPAVPPPLDEDTTPLPVPPVSLDALFGKDSP